MSDVIAEAYYQAAPDNDDEPEAAAMPVPRPPIRTNASAVNCAASVQVRACLTKTNAAPWFEFVLLEKTVHCAQDRGKLRIRVQRAVLRNVARPEEEEQFAQRSDLSLALFRR